MKKIWMNYIYSFFCYQYLKKKKDIEILENILFLVQVESIEKYSKPFICYKIYIYNNTIGITYLSDLIRVGKPIDFSYEGIYLLKNFDQYKAIFNKYQSKSKEEIRELVLTVLQNNNLSLKYFEKKAISK